jgi:regulator of nucleoside diphosphate kinase
MPNTVPPIKISDVDHRNLSALLNSLPPKAKEAAEGLEEELARADVVPSSSLPHDVVAMHSSVVYEDVDTGRVMMVQLTYPEHADIERGRVSVLAPIGAALLGLRAGDVIEWPLPDGRTARLRIKQLIQHVEDSVRDAGNAS